MTHPPVAASPLPTRGRRWQPGEAGAAAAAGLRCSDASHRSYREGLT